MADVLKQLSFTKELTDVLKVAFPGLAEIAQKTEYEITISNDSKGLRLSCYVGAPIDLESDQPAQPIEIETIEVPVDIIDNGLTMEEQERDRIIQAIVKAQGNLRKAAELLGLSERSLHRKMKKYDINVGILVKK